MKKQNQVYLNFDFSETQPYLSKVSASRVKNRASRVENEARFNFSEAQPVLSKRKVLAQFSFPRRSLTYPKLVQIISNPFFGNNSQARLLLLQTSSDGRQAHCPASPSATPPPQGHGRSAPSAARRLSHTSNISPAPCDGARNSRCL